MHNGAWTHPKEIYDPVTVESPLLFNVLLQKGGSSFFVAGTSVVSIGHEIWGDKIAEHDMYGNHGVVSMWLSEAAEQISGAPVGQIAVRHTLRATSSVQPKDEVSAITELEKGNYPDYENYHG